MQDQRLETMNFDDYESLPTNSLSTNMTAGALAGVMEHIVMYPLDSVKVSVVGGSEKGIFGYFFPTLKVLHHKKIKMRFIRTCRVNIEITVAASGKTTQ